MRIELTFIDGSQKIMTGDYVTWNQQTNELTVYRLVGANMMFNMSTMHKLTIVGKQTSNQDDQDTTNT